MARLGPQAMEEGGEVEGRRDTRGIRRLGNLEKGGDIGNAFLDREMVDGIPLSVCGRSLVVSPTPRFWFQWHQGWFLEYHENQFPVAEALQWCRIGLRRHEEASNMEKELGQLWLPTIWSIALSFETNDRWELYRCGLG